MGLVLSGVLSSRTAFTDRHAPHSIYVCISHLYSMNRNIRRANLVESISNHRQWIIVGALLLKERAGVLAYMSAYCDWIRCSHHVLSIPQALTQLDKV